MKDVFKNFGECSICYRELGYDEERNEVYFDNFIKVRVGGRLYIGRLMSEDNFKFIFGDVGYDNVLRRGDEVEGDVNYFMVRED